MDKNYLFECIKLYMHPKVADHLAEQSVWGMTNQ